MLKDDNLRGSARCLLEPNSDAASFVRLFKWDTPLHSKHGDVDKRAWTRFNLA